MIAGIDLRYHLIHWIGFNLGWQAAFSFVTYFLVGHIFEINLALLGWFGWWQFVNEAPNPGASLITMCAVLIALNLHPRRYSWWWAALFVVLGVLGPPFAWQTLRWTSLPTTYALEAHNLALDVPVLILLILLTQSWLVAATYSVPIAISATHEIAFSLAWNSAPGTAPQWSDWISLPTNLIEWLWLIAFPTAMIRWALRARRQYFREQTNACLNCGYDLEGLSPETTQCPECGSNVQSVPAAAKSAPDPLPT